jgi:hypothetical protein
MDRQRPQYHNAISPDDDHALHFPVPTVDHPARGPHDIRHPQGQVYTEPGFVPPAHLNGRHSPNPTISMPSSSYGHGFPPEQSNMGYHHVTHPSPYLSTTRLAPSGYDHSIMPSARTSTTLAEDRATHASSVQPWTHRSYSEAYSGVVAASAPRTSMVSRDGVPSGPLDFEGGVHRGWYAPPLHLIGGELILNPQLLFFLAPVAQTEGTWMDLQGQTHQARGHWCPFRTTQTSSGSRRRIMMASYRMSTG